MADLHDNRATVVLGGESVELCASKLAERFYGDRFRSDVESLGLSNANATRKQPETDDEGNPVRGKDGDPVMVDAEFELSYIGRLKFDVMVSASSRVTVAGEIPNQVIAAAWAMARAAGSTDLSYDEWLAWYLSLPSNAQEDLSLWEAVCVDLSERAFFRDFGRPDGAGEPDEDKEAE